MTTTSAVPGGVTILHLSDLQFGAKFRFTASDTMISAESLFSLLEEDLVRLRDRHDLRPDLLIVTGDLVETGGKQEFQALLKFLTTLADALSLPRSRVVLIPGNHDINRSASQAYFADCAADEVEPALPYWPKWRHFVSMFNDFYKDVQNVSFTETRPWTMFAFPELRIVVAGLNSTIADSHRSEDHYGCVGDTQLKWFAEALEPYVADGWFRIAAVHHNVRHGATDEENLRDEGRFRQFLGPRVNLVLHGHTHDGRIDFLDPHVPIVSTGSTAVGEKERPPEVPNQYQFLRITPAGLTRWTRCYYGDRRQWGGDNRATDDRGDWTETRAIAFRAVQAAQQAEGPVPSEPDAGAGFAGRDDFTSRVERVLRIGTERRIDVQPMRHSFDPIPYLAVAEQNGRFVREYAIGVLDDDVTVDLIDSFNSTIHARYRRHDPKATSKLVFGGSTPCPPELRDSAARKNIELLSWIEFQGLIDFRPFIEQQRQEILSNVLYPQSLYVPQRARYLIGREERSTDDVLDTVDTWLAIPEGRFVLVLGEFGTGKSFLLRQLALRLSEDGRPDPILIEMRSLEKARTFDELIAQKLVRSGFDTIKVPAFRYMLEQGRLALLFDGFDELAGRITYDRAAQHFETVLQAAQGAAKVVVTSRTQYFESDRQILTVLGDRVEQISGRRVARLERFTRDQIRAFLEKRLGTPDDASERMQLLDDVHDLMGLSANPRMLGFIANLNPAMLQEVRERHGRISSAELYRTLIGDWLAFERKRVEPEGAPQALTVEDRWEAVTAVALHLWHKVEPTLRLSELSESVAATIRGLADGHMEVDQATHQIGSGTLLVRDAEGNFSFAHQSLLEWLVANRAAQELDSEGSRDVLATRNLSPLMIDFLIDLCTPDAVWRWANSILADAQREEPRLLKGNALAAVTRLREKTTMPASSTFNLTGQDLKARDFSELQLVKANLGGADLTAARFVGSNLTGANLSGATLVRADLTSANLTGASVENANCTGVRLLGANIRNLNVDGASLRRAKLIGSSGQLRGIPRDVFGVARTGAPVTPLLDAPCMASQIVWSANAELIACIDRTAVRLWDGQTGEELRRFRHTAVPEHIALRADGAYLALGPTSAQTIVIYDTESGTAASQISRRKCSRPVTFGFTSTGKLLVVREDGTIGAWDVERERFKEWRQHPDPHPRHAVILDRDRVAVITGEGALNIYSETDDLVQETSAVQAELIAISSDGLHVAAGVNDDVRLYSLESKRALLLRGHSTEVVALAFDPASRRLATTSRGGTVRVWDVASGRQLAEFEGPRNDTHGLAFSLEGDYLASGAFSQRIRVWDMGTMSEVRFGELESTPVISVGFNDEGRLVFLTARGVFHWDISAGEETSRLDVSAGLRWSPRRPARLSPDARHFSEWLSPTVAQIRNATSGSVVEITTTPFVAAASHPSLYLSAQSGIATLSRTGPQSRGTPADLAKLESQNVAAAAFSRDSKHVAVAGDKGTIGLFATATRRRIADHQIGEAPREVAVSNEGDVLVRGSNAIYAFSRTAGQEQPGSFTCMAVHSGGRGFAAGDRDGRLMMKFGLITNNVLAHDAPIVTVAISEDAKFVATGSEDGTVRIFSAPEPRLLATLASYPTGTIAFRPNGRYRLKGDVGPHFGLVVALCRFKPDEIEPYLMHLRIGDHAKLIR